MAKKSTQTRSESTSKFSIVKGSSFLALVITAFLFLTSGILRFFGLDSVVGALDLIGKIFLIIGIGIPAYGFVRYKSKNYKIVFWVALIVYIGGIILGII